MPKEVAAPSKYQQNKGTINVLVAIIVVGALLLMALSLGLARYYNAKELDSLVDRAEAEGKNYSVVIHNDITGRYSFNVE